MRSLEEFIPEIVFPDALPDEALAFAFQDRSLLVHRQDSVARVPTLAELEGLGLAPVRRQFIGYLSGRAILSVELPQDWPAPEGMALKGLRSLFHALEEAHFWLAARAVQIVAWDRDHQYCGRCATPTDLVPQDRSRRCPECGLGAYPRLAPAVIVLVQRGDEVLLARSPQFLPGMYSTLAGFVEPGETLEHAVSREIEEEVGVQVKDIQYFGSQPWPFPNSLMVGFRARWASGELRPDGVEIEDAGWFTARNLPRIPPQVSIARALIDAYLAEQGMGGE